MVSSLFDLREIVLKTLSKCPKHGYQLAKEIKDQLGEEPALSSLYPLLKELEGEGLIVGHEMVEFGRFKKIYSLTPEGKKAVAKIDKQFEKVIKFMK